jgi:hypothetical protein
VSAPLIALSGVRSCVGNALDEAAALALGSLSGTGRSLLACAPLIALSGVTLAAAAASATLSIMLPLSEA